MSEGERCTHCDAPLTGPYCATCGQRVRSQRLSAPRIVREGVAEFLDLDHGILRTAIELLRAPERVVCGYWRGHTRPWVHPAKFFLLTFALAQFVAWTTGALADVARGWVDGMGPAGAAALEPLVGFLADYFVVLVGAGLVIPTAAATLLSRRTLAEQTVFSFYVFGELALLGAAILTGRWFLPAVVVDGLAVVVAPTYLAWATRRVFATGPVRTGFATLGLLAATFAGFSFAAGMLAGFAGIE